MTENDLSGKTMVVTGATSGIGLAAAEILASRGAWVIGAGRSAERCAQTEHRLCQEYPHARITYLAADLSLQSSVRRLAEQIRALVSPTAPLDALINNAGAFTYWLTLTPEGFETQWAVNHLAPFLLTHELLPLLQAAPAARVVTVSSGSHYSARLNWEDIQLRRRYNGLQAYGQTKLANVLFSLELNARQGSVSPLRAFAADPGLVKTDIGFKGTPALVRWIWKIRRSGGITAEESARGVVFLATEAAIHDSPDIYWRHGQPRRASPRALDREAASRLWQLSCQMCGI